MRGLTQSEYEALRSSLPSAPDFEIDASDVPTYRALLARGLLSETVTEEQETETDAYGTRLKVLYLRHDYLITPTGVLMMRVYEQGVR